MSNKTSVRNDIKQLAQQIETLAQQVQTNVDQGRDIMSVANELARNSSTFVFTLGEMYALEHSGKKTTKAVTGTVVSNPSGTPTTSTAGAGAAWGTTPTTTTATATTATTTVRRNFFNHRDALGRFSRI